MAKIISRLINVQSVNFLSKWSIAKMLVSEVSANILPSLVWRHTRVYCIRVFKIMKTLSCSVARNNDLLTKEETIG